MSPLCKDIHFLSNITCVDLLRVDLLRVDLLRIDLLLVDLLLVDLLRIDLLRMLNGNIHIADTIYLFTFRDVAKYYCDR